MKSAGRWLCVDASFMETLFCLCDTVQNNVWQNLDALIPVGLKTFMIWHILYLLISTHSFHNWCQCKCSWDNCTCNRQQCQRRYRNSGKDCSNICCRLKMKDVALNAIFWKWWASITVQQLIKDKVCVFKLRKLT